MRVGRNLYDGLRRTTSVCRDDRDMLPSSVGLTSTAQLAWVGVTAATSIDNRSEASLKE